MVVLAVALSIPADPLASIGWRLNVTTPEERSKSFDAMGVSSNLGFVIGPALAGALGSTRLGDRLPVYATMGVSLTAAGSRPQMTSSDFETRFVLSSSLEKR
jgi:hypothetical protein